MIRDQLTGLPGNRCNARATSNAYDSFHVH